MRPLAHDPSLNWETRDEGAGWVWVVSQCGWPPLSGRAPSHASAERAAAFAASVASALARIGGRRF